VDNINDPCDEMEFIKIVLEYDAKNYHAWAYRLSINTFILYFIIYLFPIY